MGQKTTVIHGDNSTEMYLKALHLLLKNGKEYAPRGKRIKELRPVVFEFNPASRVTFAEGRVINPFFQLAESFWIATGRSDVKWLTDYNKSIAQFSDDGVFFNAPYGERLRHWGKNDARNFILNPIDQLYDVYLKLKADLDTRQAVGFIGNPHFDSSEYTLGGGKDIACNINIKFKVRDGKLDISVDNRSNDLHWGTFGANLCQFSTILELMASWLGVGMGTYFQITDSLHIYLDDYGYKETDKIQKCYPMIDKLSPLADEYLSHEEPRMSANYEEFSDIAEHYYSVVEPAITSDIVWNHVDAWTSALEEILKCPDDYWRMTFTAMFVKQARNRGITDGIYEGMRHMKDSSWKVSCLRHLSKAYGNEDGFKSLYSHLPEDIIKYITREEG